MFPASSQFTTVFDSLLGYSRWVPVVLNILKQPGTWAGSTRLIPDLQGCPWCRHDCDTVHHGSSRIIEPGWTGTLKPRSHCPGLRCRFIPVWWSGMNRDEPCHNRCAIVDNLGDPGWTVLNRLMSPVVLKCLKQPGLTGSNREDCQIPW